MIQQLVVGNLTRQLHSYANELRSEVNKGEVVPHVAILMLKEYAKGLKDSAQSLFNDPTVADPINDGLQEELRELSPQLNEL